MIRNELKTGPWNLSDLKHVKPNGMKVFSCFCCGGGSTMGYKLAGFEVLGGVEIDPEIANIYRANHNPKHFYRMGVGDFNKIPNDKLPKELFELDILDGSPPCSSFSMAGSREKKWGVKKKFREGQTEQVLDDLFFHFINTAKKLNPKVVVAENVKGLIQGNARGYVKQIFKGFKDAGYTCQLFLLNAAAMGVPQKRERTFFIANRLGKKISLGFNEKQISILKSWDGIANDKGKDCSQSSMVKYWNKIKPGQAMSAAHEKGSLFGQIKIDPNRPSNTVTSKEYQLWHWESPRLLSNKQILRLQTFPDDYNCKDSKYICGMSVPPFMTQRVADQIYRQLL
jgi:DNA (cytosine-5)-methyltransferase 1